MPEFSIIIPVYNVEPYVRTCLDSILKQTTAEWEAICIDDGSTDASGAILDGYAAKDSRFHVIHQKNAGVSAARNRGLEVATGGWVTFVDPDDWLELDLYERVLLRIAQHPDADVIVQRAIWHSNSTDDPPIKRKRLPPRIFNSGDEALGAVQTEYGHILYCVWDKFFRRSVVERLQLRFDTALQLSEDCQFAQEFFAQCGKVVAACDIQGYHYRANPGGAIRRMTVGMCEQQLARFERSFVIWRKTGKKGLLKLLVRTAALLPSLGKTGGNGIELRARCVEMLLENSIFTRRVLWLLLWHGTCKARCFALLFYSLPYCLRRKLLERL